MKPLVIRRTRAAGDVLLCTPLVRACSLHFRNDIYFDTSYPALFANNPCISKKPLRFALPRHDADVIPAAYALVDCDKVIYEKLHHTHLIDAFGSAAGFKTGELEKRLELHFPPPETIPEFPVCGIVVHVAPTSWIGKDWPMEYWKQLVAQLQKRGHDVTVVGDKVDSTGFKHDLRGKLDFQQLAHVITMSRLFIGPDSFPAHVAGARRTPRVVLFGITRARYILCDSPRTIAVESPESHPWSGARHDQRVWKVLDGRPPENPMLEISVEEVFAAAQSLL